MSNNNIKSKIKVYIVSQLDGFNDFDYLDNLSDMGILTDNFVSDLIGFIKKEFQVKNIYEHDLDKKSLSITSIGNLIEQKMKGSQKMQVNVNQVTCIV